MKTQWLVILAAGAVLLSATLPASAGNKGGKNRDSAGIGRNRGVETSCRFSELGLSDEQQTQIDELREATRTENLARRVELQQLQAELKAEMLKPTPDAGQVRTIAKEMNRLRGEQKLNRLEHKLAVRKLLTPEQQTKMLSISSGKMAGKGQRGQEAGRKFGQGHRGGDNQSMRRGGGRQNNSRSHHKSEFKGCGCGCGR